MQAKERNSNIELLRIIMMLLIIAHHYIAHGNFQLPSYITINTIFLDCLYWGGKTGINIFILITGYYMINSSFKISKIVRIWVDLFIYSVTITAIFMIIGKHPISLFNIMKSILPFSFGAHNYISTYLMLYCMIPFLNKAIHSIDKKMLERLMIFMFVILSLIPTVMSVFIGWVNNTYSYLFWMIFVYIVGAYIKLYKYKININKKIICLNVIVSIGICILLTTLMGQIPAIRKYYFVENVNLVPIVYAAISIFVFVLNTKNFSNKVINYIASSVLAVYLIHDDILIRNYVWTNIFKGYKLIQHTIFMVNIIVSVIFIFVVCIIIDKLKLTIFGNVIDKFIVLIERKVARINSNETRKN